MLRSLYAANSGMKAHQAKLDVTSNNLANASTVGFKGSTIRFQDVMSQTLRNAGAPGTGVGGTNPSQIGLGVSIAGVSTNNTQGSLQVTGRATDLAISGSGYFMVRDGAETLYTRAGEFDVDKNGNLVNTNGQLVQGFPVTNGVQGGVPASIKVGLGSTSAPVPTTAVAMKGNLPAETAVGESILRDVPGYTAAGDKINVSMEFTRTATGWDMGLTTPGGTAAGTYGTDTALTAGGITVDLAEITDFAGVETIAFGPQDGRGTGVIESYSIGPDGSVVGSFSNGHKEVMAMLAMANFVNPDGLEKAGNSTYRASLNSGEPMVGPPGTNGNGKLSAGTLEMSNVDMSTEMTNLITAQRGFQASARITTVSDSILEELNGLKR